MEQKQEQREAGRAACRHQTYRPAATPERIGVDFGDEQTQAYGSLG
ncbi:hypothetical protein ACQ4WX_37885 [Streptomyces lasalocidi]